MNGYRIVLADDHAMFRQGLRRIIEGAKGLHVVGEAADGSELLSVLRMARPDMVILDISMPHVSGFEALHSIKELHGGTKVLILTMHKDAEYVSRALSAGADGYVLKEDADRDLFSAIKKIRNGVSFLSPRLSEGFPEDSSWFPRATLSAREKEILKLVAEGNSNKEIADIFSISVRTVERHRTNIMSKLDLKNTADLVKYALRRGYV